MHIIDILIIVAFLATTLYVGFRSGKNIKTFEDYAIGNRKFTDFAIFCTVAATIIGGTVTIGNVGKFYDVGITQFLSQIGEPIAYLIVTFFLARKFSLYYGCCSLGDMFFKAYGIKGKLLSGVVGSLYETFGVGLQFIAMGTAISTLTGFSYNTSLLVAGGIILIYTGRGGIRAVTFTDVLQFVVLIVALPILLITVLTKIGGLGSLWSQLPQSHVSITGENFNRYIFLIFPMLLITFSPHHVQRLLMVSSYKQGAKAFYHLSWVFLLIVVMTIFLGLSARVLFPGLPRPDQALLMLMTNYLPVGVFGFSLAGILAILMSTADSNINSGSIVLLNDVVIPCNSCIRGKDLTEKQKLRLARIFSLIIGIFAYVFAKHCTSIFETRIFIRTLWFSVILSPLYFLLFNMKISVRGLATSAIVGLITFIMWNLNIKPVTKIDGLFPGFFANIITVLFFYFLGGKQKVFSKEHLAFDQ